MAFRVEKDSMGEFKVPAKALYGAQTARAVANFPVSGSGLDREMIRALGLIKYSAAAVNRELGKLKPKIASAVMKASREVADGEFDDQFPIDVFQTGSGTSSNMNANEVISNRAIQMLKGKIGSKHPVHPNDHVNMGQSSNDVFPTAIHVAAVTLIEKELVPSLKNLHSSLAAKARLFDGVIKIGRTHLQDATPIRVGQVFSGYASQVEHCIGHVKDSLPHLRELAIGGTAVGTGINTHPMFGRKMAKKLGQLTGSKFVEAPNHFEAQAAKDAAVHASGSMKTAAVSLMKIANDIRFLASGPRLGLGELEIPAVQPGSSIMPGKINPVIAESLIMACVQVIGNDAAVTLCGLYSNFELNTMMPLIAKNLLEQIKLLANASKIFNDKLVRGLRANRKRIEEQNERSLSLATSLAPLIGYDRAAEIAKEALHTGRTVRQVAADKKVLPNAVLKKALDLRRQTKPEKD